MDITGDVGDQIDVRQRGCQRRDRRRIGHVELARFDTL
jgi:hypothetical protein